VGFSKIYDICDCKDISMARGAQLEWQLPLRRMTDTAVYEEWCQMQVMLQGCRFHLIQTRLSGACQSLNNSLLGHFINS
jgi:hypothetical protein